MLTPGDEGMARAIRKAEELAAEIMRQNEIKEDYVVNSPCLQMDAWDSDLFLRVMDGQQTDRLEPLEISENRLNTITGCSRKVRIFLRRM